MAQRQFWYTRRGNEIRGPFPAGQISRFILLGRLREDDELSADQHNWQTVAELPVLIPKEMQADLSDTEAYERLMIARLREDERGARDRRDDNDAADNEQQQQRRTGDDRRAWEAEQTVRHREIKTAIAEAAQQQKSPYFLPGVAMLVFLSAVISAAWYYQPWQPQDNIDCQARPQPWVNWSNCLMEGARLAATDLRGARLRNANLAGADLRGARLVGADIAYTNLVGALLGEAILDQASLVGANLRSADLSYATLSGANLSYAILRDSRLNGANLVAADLRHANLQDSDLDSADLSDALLGGAIWVDGRICGSNAIGHCRAD